MLECSEQRRGCLPWQRVLAQKSEVGTCIYPYELNALLCSMTARLYGSFAQLLINLGGAGDSGSMRTGQVERPQEGGRDSRCRSMKHYYHVYSLSAECICPIYM